MTTFGEGLSSKDKVVLADLLKHHGISWQSLNDSQKSLLRGIVTGIQSCDPFGCYTPAEALAAEKQSNLRSALQAVK